MDKAEVIAHVAGDLSATETSIDEAIVRATTLIQSMVGARAQLSLSPVVANASQAKAMEAIAALGAAREAIVACHGEMAKDHRRLGWGTYAIGTLDKYPEGERPRVEQHLRAV